MRTAYLQKNIAKSNGGVTYIQDDAPVIISNSDFEYNLAGSVGGVFDGYSITVLGSRFTQNKANFSAGVFRVRLNGTLWRIANLTTTVP